MKTNGNAAWCRTSVMRSTALAIACSIAATSAGAQAQDLPAPPQTTEPESPEADGLQEIIVTAQRRDERLQSVPIAISAFTAETLQSSGVTDTLQLQTITPGLTISRALTSVTPFIRGVGTVDVGAGNEAAVAVYIDGVYVVATPATMFSFNNIERIEVLKGPQGTLFGRNATGGLIQVITKAASETPTGRFEIGYANYDTVSGSAYVSGGLGGDFRADFAVTASNQGDGWGRNIFTGRDVYRTKEVGVRAKLEYVGSRTHATLAVLYADRDSDNGTGIQAYPGSRLTGGATTQSNGGGFNINNQFTPEARSKVLIPSLKIAHDMDFGTLVNVASYQDVTSDVVNGIDGVPLRISDGSLTQTSEAFTEELQLVSPSGSPVKWIVGGFYMQRIGKFDPSQSLNPTAIIDTFGRQKTTSLSGFVQVTVPVATGTNVTGGIRYNTDKQEASTRRLVNGVAAGPPTSDSATFNNVSWRASLDQQLAEDVLIYASYNRGFKAGLFNLISSPVSSGRARPEEIDAFELGLKSEFFDNRLRLNISGYHYNYRDSQIAFIRNGSVFTLNADKIRITGLDVEAIAAPTRGLRIHAGLSWIFDAVYEKFDGAPLTTPATAGGNIITIGSAAGNRPSRTPEITTNLSIDYTLPTPIGDLDFNATHNYISRQFWQPDNRISQPGYNVVNLLARLHLTETTWASVFAKNIFDKRYYVYGTSPQSGDVGTLGAPQTYGVSIGYKF